MSRHPSRPSFRALSPPTLAALLFASALAALPPASLAGTLHPAAAEELNRLRPADEATVLLILDDQAPIPALNDALKRERTGLAERHRRVLLELQQAASRSQGPLLQELERLRARGMVSRYRSYWISNLVRVRGQRAAIEALVSRADIAVVERAVRPQLIAPVGERPVIGAGKGRGEATPGLRAIRAPEVWRDFGLNGAGVLVANMDTGVDGTHPALADRWRGRNGQHPWPECWLDVVGTNTEFPTDAGSHGTHVMGTICGLDAGTEDSIGVAWGAEWIACNAIGQNSNPDFDGDVIACFEWLADPDGNPNTIDDVPAVVQNSWRVHEGFSGYTDCDSRWWEAIDNCEAAGVVVTFSAGNEGPNPSTIGSPPDRALTPYNAFSIGAVDATHYEFPYPIASFSSRGPTGCDVIPSLKIKPEVSAPGVTVWSSIPDSGYTNMDGTSMAGPHVAGAVALIRAANPDLDVDSIKQILMETARDLGDPGEDNTFGWGVIDVYAAVSYALSDLGRIEGSATNGSNGGSPVHLAQVRLAEIGRDLYTNQAGFYTGVAAPGTYTLEVTHPSFASVVLPGVTLVNQQTTVQDVVLTDILGPQFLDLQFPETWQDPDHPVAVSTRIYEESSLDLAEVHWRVDGGPFQTVPLIAQPTGRHEGLIPGQPVGSLIEFYLRGVDRVANEGIDPPGAPADLYAIRMTRAYFVDDAEEDRGWVLSASGDAVNGRWVRMDPYGTMHLSTPVEPADDHTPDPGVNCFVTGAGMPDGPASGSDVDAGCVTLLSPVIDLAGAQEAVLSYWRWFANVNGPGGSFTVTASHDNGTTWVQVEQLLNLSANQWTFRSFDLGTLLPLTSQLRVRFVACDTGIESLVEAAVDDFLVEGMPVPAAVPGDDDSNGSSMLPATALRPGRPSPFERETLISYRLGVAGPVRLTVYDPSGRSVRTLVRGDQAAGEQVARWAGGVASGGELGAGVFFYLLRAAYLAAQRKILLLR